MDETVVEQPRKRLVVMRGLPWAGKSTRAKEIAGDTGVIYSTDEYWYKIRHPDKPDHYSFNPRYLGDAHHWNQKRCHRSIEAGHPLIVIDNTNTTPAEAKPYVEYAVHQDYEIEIAEPTSPRWLEIAPLLLDKRGNKKELKAWAKVLAEGSQETHGVPEWSIERMMWRWVPNITVDQILESTSINGGN
jgi:predicted kinase